MADESLESIMQTGLKEFQTSMDSRTKGDLDGTRIHLLKASEKLFKASSLSQGSLRESRKQLAQQLLDEANSLTTASLPVQTAPSNKANISLGDDAQAESWIVREKPDIRFEDIAGLEDVKEQIRLKLLYPFTHADVARQYGINPGGGMLLYGPPGTGKTLIARAVAGEIDAAFFSITPSEVMSQWVGVAEQNITRLFAEAESYPLSVIFFDEMESLSPKRRQSGSTIMVRVVPQLLAELDGFAKRKNPLLLIGATNEPWALDPAMMRPGRLDRLVYVPPPDLAARQKILEMNLTQAPVDEKVDLSIVATATNGFSGADLAELAKRTREKVFSEAVHLGIIRPICQEDFSTVLETMQPSISEKEVQLYEEYASGKSRFTKNK
jgi:transitional endoplasmic reticulum ATPase